VILINSFRTKVIRLVKTTLIPLTTTAASAAATARKAATATKNKNNNSNYVATPIKSFVIRFHQHQ
jgi:hypothetical protein